jgi:hypothetical protein
MQARLRTAADLAVLAVLVLAAAGCPSDPSAPSDVIYQGGTTDEAWISMDEADVMVSDADAPMLTDPTAWCPVVLP